MFLLYTFIHAYNIYAWGKEWGRGVGGGSGGVGREGRVGQKVNRLFTYTLHVFHFEGCILYMYIHIYYTCF